MPSDLQIFFNRLINACKQLQDSYKNEIHAQKSDKKNKNNVFLNEDQHDNRELQFLINILRVAYKFDSFTDLARISLLLIFSLSNCSVTGSWFY